MRHSAGSALVAALFFGLKAAVLAIVLEAVLRIGRRALRNAVMVTLAAAAFVAIFLLHVPFPLVILGAGLIGWLGGRAGLGAFQPGGGHGRIGARQVADADSVLGEHLPAHARPPLAWSLRIAASFLVLWLAPTALLLLSLGADNVFSQSRSSSRRWRWSPSAAPMRCWPTSRRPRSAPMAGSSRARCWTGSASPRPRPGR